MIQCGRLCALFAGLTLTLVAPASATEYLIQDLGPVTSVAGINNRGEVLATDANGPFLYHCGTADYLPQPPGGTFTTEALNNSGEVVGYFNRFGMYDYNLAIYRDGELKIFDEIGGVVPVKVNSRGQIAGDLVREYRAFIYSHGTLAAFSPAGSVSATRGMNDKGEIVGVTLNGPSRLGFVYRNGRFTTLSVPGAASSEADAINRRGEIAGIWDESAGQSLPRIFVYSRGHFHDLGHVFGQSVEQDLVSGMNRFGVIVGWGRTLTIPNGGFSAYAYYPCQGFVELNTLIPPDAGWFLQFADGINDRGQIVGRGLLGGAMHGYILTPVDETAEDETPESGVPE